MKRFLLSIGISLCFLGSGFGQEPGDIAIVRYNTDAPDGFSFVALTSIASGDSIFFTDEGWDDTAGSTGWRVSGEEHLKYISPGLSAGDVVHIEETSIDNFTVSGSGGTVSLRRGTGFSLGTGDQIIAYSGSEVRPSSPLFLTAIHGDDGTGTTTGSNDPNTKWTRDGEVSGVQQSTIPDRLINGVSAVSVFGDSETEVDNMIYNCTVTTGNKSELLLAINNRSNWTTNDSSNQPTSSVCSFTVNSGLSTIVSGSAGWRLLSLPKTGGTVQDVSDDTPVQGVTGGDDASSTTNFIIYDNDAEFEKPTNVSTAWGDGYGFGLYFYNNTTNGSSTLPVTLDASGTEPSSDVAVTLNPAASGYTLVGNPFASNFNTNNITSSVASIQNTIHFWNGSSYVGQDRTASGGYIIAPWQGFWVQKDATANAATLTFPTSGKTTSSTSGTYFKSTNQRGDIKFTLASEIALDEDLRLAFRPDATFGYDLDDSGKLFPLLPAYATMAFESNDMLKSVESLPYNLEEEVTLSLQPQMVGVSGEFTFAWNGLETIPGEWELILHDYETGANIDMRSESEYTFFQAAHAKVSSNPLSLLNGPAAVAMKAKAEGNRFGITIRPTSVSNETEESPALFALEQNYPNPFNPSTTISYSVQEAGVVNISVYNLMGQKVATLVDETKAAGQYNVRWNAAGAASGMYYYRLEAGGQSITRKMTLIK